MSERTQTGETTIVRAAIYPAIGIARVGNSESEYFLAPEVTDPLPEPPGSYRDPTGALKRQAVRFRIYGLNAAGAPVAELTAENAEIRWTVHLANKKSAWYQFQIALDIETASLRPPLLRIRSRRQRSLLRGLAALLQAVAARPTGCSPVSAPAWDQRSRYRGPPPKHPARS